MKCIQVNGDGMIKSNTDNEFLQEVTFSQILSQNGNKNCDISIQSLMKNVNGIQHDINCYVS